MLVDPERRSSATEVVEFGGGGGADPASVMKGSYKNGVEDSAGVRAKQRSSDP